MGQRNGASPNNPTINHGASGSTQEGIAGERLEKSASPITSTHRGDNTDQQKQGRRSNTKKMGQAYYNEYSSLAGFRLGKRASLITTSTRHHPRINKQRLALFLVPNAKPTDQQKQSLPHFLGDNASAADFFDPNATPHFSSHSPGEQTVIEQIATSNNAVLDWLRIKNT